MLEYHSVWLKGRLGLLNSFDARIRCRTQLMYFFFLGNPHELAKLRPKNTRKACDEFTKHFLLSYRLCVGRVAQSIQRLTKAGRSGIESQWGRDFPPVQTGPGPHPASCKMGTESLPVVKCGPGVLLTTHPLLVPRSWKSRAIPLPTLWATPGL